MRETQAAGTLYGERSLQMSLEIVPGLEHPGEIAALFSEYTSYLTENDPSFREYLAIQHYDEELAHLERKYKAPGGRLYLALWDGAPAGCIGMRRISESICEMKRLYVRPEYRGHGIARTLAERLLRDAGEAGYSQMVLDTLPFLDGALRLYRSLGFAEIPCYNDSPLSTSIYLGRRL